MKTGFVLALASLAGCAAVSSAATIATLAYNDLSGNYTGSAAGGTFNAHATNIPGSAGLRSAGNVARIVSTVATANFEPGFVADGHQGNFVLNMTLGAISGGGRTGVGSFTSTDSNGDTVTSNLSGNWQLSGGFLAFAGVLSNVVFHNNSGDNTFNGTNTGSFSIGDLTSQIFTGAIVNLTTSPDGGFFTNNFSDASSGINAQVQTVPLPTAAWAGLATLGGAMAIRHFRRR